MDFKEMLKRSIMGICAPEELRGSCKQYNDCSECNGQAFSKLIELLERDYVEKERDSLEKIEREARFGAWSYWKCAGFGCDECPSLLEDKKPSDFYEVATCEKAQMMDLLRRQRELLEGNNAN